MGVDTTFYDSLLICFDEKEDFFPEALKEAWETFIQQTLVIDGEETRCCWDLDGDTLVASESIRGYPDFWVKWLIHIHQCILIPNDIHCFENPIPWRCVHSAGVDSGVLYVGCDEIKLVTVDEQGGVETITHPLE